MNDTNAGSGEESQFSRGDVVSGAVLAALGLFIILDARHWNYMSADGPGPGFFPLWYGIVMLVLALLLVGGNLMRRHGARRSKPVDPAPVARALTAWAAFIVGVALLPVLGFILGFALLTAFVVAVLYRKPLRVALLVGACSAAGFYLVFPLALQVTLPVGVFGF